MKKTKHFLPMRYSLFVLFALLPLSSCDTLQQVAGAVLEQPLSSADIGNGLKEALNNGISKGADALSAQDGYFKSAYKILLPPEARKITEKLRIVPGFDQVENVLLEKINRGAEDAAKAAKPIFVQAIREMTFDDAMRILMGDKNAATQYLNNKTYNALYQAFQPKIVESLNKFNAIEYWAKAVNAYNKIPLVDKANPKLDDYITHEALKGLFSMVENEERNIRANVGARTTDLLKRVFAKQDHTTGGGTF